MFKIKHLLDENEKITTLNSEKELIDFTKTILKENEDETSLYEMKNSNDCLIYINFFCDNLKII